MKNHFKPIFPQYLHTVYQRYVIKVYDKRATIAMSALFKLLSKTHSSAHDPFLYSQCHMRGRY